MPVSILTMTYEARGHVVSRAFDGPRSAHKGMTAEEAAPRGCRGLQVRWEDGLRRPWWLMACWLVSARDVRAEVADTRGRRPRTSQSGVSGQVMVRADSGYCRRDLISAALKAKAWFSVTVRMNPAVVRRSQGSERTRGPRSSTRGRSPTRTRSGGSPKRRSPKPRSPRSRPPRRPSRYRAGWWCAGSSASTPGRRPVRVAVRQLASPRVRHQLLPDRNRGGRDPP